jgi:hypothetical protein
MGGTPPVRVGMLQLLGTPLRTPCRRAAAVHAVLSQLRAAAGLRRARRAGGTRDLPCRVRSGRQSMAAAIVLIQRSHRARHQPDA